MTAKSNLERGFTLLEVIVALAITGFVLGSQFALLGASKQLTFRSNSALLETAELRAAVNFALLENDYNDVEPILRGETFTIRAGGLLENPLRKTAGTTLALEAYEILDRDGVATATGARWVRLPLPR